MHIVNVATIGFQDASSGEGARAIVRATKGQMYLCLSLERDGDIEVAFAAADFAKLLVALEKAMTIVQDERSRSRP
jgi:hypothetical protein